MTKRNRRVFSIKQELVSKSCEAALSAVQIFNNPNISFKSESYIVLMIIAWTYLLHAYFREKKIDYRYSINNGKRKEFKKTKHGLIKHWELEKCLRYESCPLDNSTKNNLLFLIELRHEIEHQMALDLDQFIGAKLQACCLNYNRYLQEIFGQKIAHLQPLSLQFFTFSDEQVSTLKNQKDLPKNVIDFVSSFEDALSSEEKMSSA